MVAHHSGGERQQLRPPTHERRRQATGGRAKIGARPSNTVARRFGISADFAIDAALERLRELDLVSEAGGLLSAVPLADALSRLGEEWQGFFDACGAPQGRK